MNGERAKDSINVGASVLLHTYLKIDDQVKYISRRHAFIAML